MNIYQSTQLYAYVPTIKRVLKQLIRYKLRLSVVIVAILLGITLIAHGFSSRSTKPKNLYVAKITPSQVFPSQSISTNIAEWIIFNKSEGVYSFKHPDAIKVSETSSIVSARFPKREGQVNQENFYIEKEQSNKYNRPLDKFIKEHLRENEEIYKTTIAGLPAWSMQDFWENSKYERIYVQSGEEIYVIRFYNYEPFHEYDEIFELILSTLTFHPSAEKTTEVKVVDGTILVTIDRQANAITTSDFNSEPVLSPDKSKVAYLNGNRVMLINADGTNPIQIVDSVSSVNRSNLHWVDNDRLIFIDGEESARVYIPSRNAMFTLFGPEQPTAACYDACGYVKYHTYSPDYRYLVNMHLGYRLIDGQSAIRAVNTSTLHAIEIANPYSTCISDDSIIFAEEGDKLIFSSNTELGSCDGDDIEVTIDLETGEMTTRSL